MIQPPNNFIDAWGINKVKFSYPRLRICQAEVRGYVCLQGIFEFTASKPGFPNISDSFEIRIEVPYEFPFSAPLVFPLGARLPKDFHRLENGALCLGSPTRQLLFLRKRPCVREFVNAFLVPYLYGYVVYERNKSLPFGELAHGRRGLIEDFKDLYGVAGDEAAKKLVQLTSRPKRKANQSKCPCGSNKRLSSCKLHHQKVLILRKALGRIWFRDQYKLIAGGTGKRI